MESKDSLAVRMSRASKEKSNEPAKLSKRSHGAAFATQVAPEHYANLMEAFVTHAQDSTTKFIVTIDKVPKKYLETDPGSESISQPKKVAKVQINSAPIASAEKAPLKKHQPNLVKLPQVVKSALNPLTGMECEVPVAAALSEDPKPCSFFPSCQFGSKCKNIHPDIACKFQERCANPICNYSHSNKPKTPCRFGAGCANRACVYDHPIGTSQPAVTSDPSQILCRFDLICNKISCPFLHPKRDLKHQSFEKSSTSLAVHV